MTDAKPLPIGVPTGPLSATPVLPDRVEGARGKGIAVALLGLAADDDLLEGERRAGGLEDRDDGVGDLRADAVAADQGDGAGSGLTAAPSSRRARRKDHADLADRRRRRLLDDEVGEPPLPALALAGDAAEPQHQVAGDRLGLVAREGDAELLLEVVEAEAPVEQVGAVAGRRRSPGCSSSYSSWIGPSSASIASSIVDEAGRSAVLVDDDGHVRAAAAHLAEEILGALELGHEEGRIDVLRERKRLLLGVGEVEEVLGVEDADDVVERAAVDRQARELLLAQERADVGEARRSRAGRRSWCAAP